MLLTLTADAAPPLDDARDLGHLLHKHPDRAQQLSVSGGTAHVVWPQAGPDRASVAVLLEIDPVGPVRGGRRGGTASVAQYVDDRPYAASSTLSVALGALFRTAMNGRCDSRPELAASALDLEVHLPCVGVRGDGHDGSHLGDVVERLFGPLGWAVTTAAVPLDPQVPAWGDSRYLDVRLRGRLRVADALTQLYVLLPVLDDAKHYWVGEDEVDKLLRAGAGWLPGHPERDLVTRRYLRHARDLVGTAAGRLAEIDGVLPAEDDPGPAPDGDGAPPPLGRLRVEAVLAALDEVGARSVVDLGCGEGALLRELVRRPEPATTLGVDVSARVLAVAERRLGLDRLPDRVRERVRLVQSSATYRDERLAGHDAVVLMEVVEHVDPPRLPALERSVFHHARPGAVVVTTPNVEHNVLYPGLADGRLRHRDHRFEWTRAQFRDWADGVAAAHGYSVELRGVGPDHPEHGPPSQLALFREDAR